MHFSYSPSVQKCVSVKFIFNKIHYMNLWHFFCPLHFQALIDSTWKLCCSPPGHVTQPPRVTWHAPRVTWRAPGSRDAAPRVTSLPGTAAMFLRPAGWHIQRQEVPWVNRNVSENTFGVIFGNVRFGDDRTVSFPGSFSTPKFQRAR